MLAVFLDQESLDRGDMDLSPLHAVLGEWCFYPATTPAQVQERIAGASVVITNKVVLDKSILQSASALRLICVAATGTNNVDIEAARALGITVCNVRGYATASVVQQVFAMMLALSGRLIDYHTAVQQGRWQRSSQFCLLDFPIREIAGKTLGIVGYGELGQAVAAVARAFGMKALIAQRPGAAPAQDRVPLRELLPQADVLSLHCPLTPETRGLIGARELALMPSHALLINTARGGIVDESALAEALRSGRLAGAGVDVLTVEPPRAGNPLLAGNIPNLIVTPHIAWASRESRQRLVAEIAANIRAFLEDTPRNIM